MRLKEASGTVNSRTMEDLEGLSRDMARLAAFTGDLACSPGQFGNSLLVFEVLATSAGGGSSTLRDGVTNARLVRVTCDRSVFWARCRNLADVTTRHKKLDALSESSTTIVDLSSVPADSETFNKFRDFVYTGRMDLSQPVKFVELLRLGNLFGINSLRLLCISHVKNFLTFSCVAEVLNEAVSLGEEVNSNDLNAIFQFIRDNLQALRERRLLMSLTKESLVALVKSSSLNIPENEVWRVCAEWGRNQAGIEDERPPQAWEDRERTAMRTALQGVVHHVKILNIDSGVFAEEVEPTGAIPMELSLERYRQAAFAPAPTGVGQRGDGNRVFTAAAKPPPQRSGDDQRSYQRQSQDLSRLNPRVEPVPNLTAQQTRPPHPQHHPPSLSLFQGSSILRSLATATSTDCTVYERLLNSWAGTAGHSWRVIFRASEHQFSAQAFHKTCDGVSPSFVLVKSDTGCVGGGYTDVAWSMPVGKGRYMASDQSFLFSLYNSAAHPTKFTIKKKLFAVSHHPDCGPVFGAGADLFICDRCDRQPDSYSNLPHSYDGQDASCESLLGDYNFLVEEYEVFVPAT